MSRKFVARQVVTRFYHYGQSNPGGRYDEDAPRDLYVEAESPEHADTIAIEFGVYFDGVADGKDCPCCGNRWERASDWDSEEMWEDCPASCTIVSFSKADRFVES